MAIQSSSAISLRAYNREIEGMIEGGHIDEAIAHCRHILQTFPKHVASYRLLGKAYLEAQRYADAADVFQRVLSVIPDDFVSQAGMSIVREDESNLDAAIWHMERAYEAQPYNNAIQGELRRLYGLRDKVAPPKVRLTRGALARMYAKGDLHQQAIGELRAALAEDPQRPDLQSLLAQSYYRAGQRVEAVETCSNLLKKFPYCLEANRILAAILPETERAADTPIYRQRVTVLDPYFAKAPENVTTSDGVPDNAIGLERLTWKPGQSMGLQGSQPAWAASLGVTIKDQPESLPDWMLPDGEAAESSRQAKPGTGPTLSHSVKPTTGGLLQKKTAGAPPDAAWPTAMTPETGGPDSGALLPAEPAEDIPDWMKEAGWTSASGAEAGAALEGVSPFAMTPDETPGLDLGLTGPGELAPAELPDWMRDLAPPGVNDLSAPGSGLGVGETQPGRISSIETALPWLQENPPGPTDTVVNWLGAEKGTPPASQPVEPAEALPDWLVGDADSLSRPAPAQDASASAAAAPELPDWLQSLQPPAETAPETAASQPWMAAPPAQAPAQSEIPDWLRMDETVETAPTSDEGLPDWLKVAAPDAGVPEASVPDASAPAAAANVDIPDWLKETALEPTAEVPPVISGTPEAGLPDLGAPEAGAPESGAPDSGNLADWLRTISEEPAAAPSAAPKPSELPDWLAGLSAVETEQESTGVTDWLGQVGQTIPPSESEALPEWLREDTAPAVPTSADSFPDWLKAMPGAPAAAFPDETQQAAEPESRSPETEALPEWLIDTSPLKPSQPPAPPTPAEALPEWLKPLEAEAPPAYPAAASEPAAPVESSAPAPAEGLPDWLQAPPPPAQSPAAAPSGGLPSLEDQDAALAWLESLAAKQGVPEEEMISRPETRLETPPDWVAKEAIQTEAALPAEPASGAAPAEAGLPDWLAAIEAGAPDAGVPGAGVQEAAAVAPAGIEPLVAEPVEELPDWLKATAAPPTPAEKTFEPPAAEMITPATPAAPGLPSLEDQDAAMAWLESLAAKQGAPEEEMITRPETRLEAPPTWVTEEAARAEAGFVPTPAAEALPTEALPDWLRAAQAEIPETPAVEAEFVLTPAAEALPTEALPDWLRAAQAEIPETPAVEAEFVPTPAAEALPAEALPDWLRAAQAEIPETPAVEAEFVPTPAAEALPAEALPDWLKAAQAEIPETPAVEAEFVLTPAAEALPAEALPDWLKAVQAEIPEAPAVEAEFLPTPAAEALPAEALPDWLKAVQAEIPEAPAVEAEFVPTPPAEALPAEALPDWLKAAQAEIPEAPAVEAESTLAPEPAALALPDWLKAAAIEPAETEIPSAEPVIETPASAAPGLPSLEDQDAAMAWLESLAAKQGVPEEELLTRPGERIETPPEWVIEEATRGEPPAPPLAEMEETPEALQTWQPEPEEAAPVETTPAAPTPMSGLPSLEDQDAAMAWLESLAAKQGVPEAELLTRPDERTATPPEWVVEEAAAPAAEAIPAPEAGVPAWLAEIEAEIPAEAAPAIAPEPVVVEAALPEWITEPEPALATTYEEPVLPAEIEAALPQWAEQAAQAPEVGAPAEKLDLNSASLVGLEALPGIGFVLAQSIIAYRDTYGPFARIEDLEKISGIGPVMVEELRPYVTVTPEEAAAAARVPVTPETDALAQARAALQKGDISAAAERYDALLKQGQLAGAVILDIQDALYRFPVDIALWQILGDAYMRNNQLQDALDAYTKAEELLR